MRFAIVAHGGSVGILWDICGNMGKTLSVAYETCWCYGRCVNVKDDTFLAIREVCNCCAWGFWSLCGHSVVTLWSLCGICMEITVSAWV